MLKIIKVLSLTLLGGLTFQACVSSNDETIDESTLPAEGVEAFIDADSYLTLQASDSGKALFAGVQSAGGQAELCDITIRRLVYDTVGGAGEATKSSGVLMMPSGDPEHCSGDRPVVLYAHGTTAEKSYDLSRFVGNAASSEAAILIATYASQGYAVIAPNYAGYADSTLGYHPYLIEEQQSTEMIDILSYVRDNTASLEARLSDKLFVTGLSQGGYVAMATHKAMQAQSIAVTASLPISGPYTMLPFIDTVFSGTVNGGATTFAPLYIDALQQSFGLYDDPSEVYSADFAEAADNALPGLGGLAATDFAEAALFNIDGAPPLPITPNGFGSDFGMSFLIADSFRGAYLGDAAANPASLTGPIAAPSHPARIRLNDADLRNWSPSPSLGAPLMMCGAGGANPLTTDPVVFHSANTSLMVSYWSALVGAGLVINLDLNDSPAGPFALIQGAWQAAAVPLPAIHGTTGVFCGLAGLNFFNSLL